LKDEKKVQEGELEDSSFSFPSSPKAATATSKELPLEVIRAIGQAIRNKKDPEAAGTAALMEWRQKQWERLPQQVRERLLQTDAEAKAGECDFPSRRKTLEELPEFDPEFKKATLFSQIKTKDGKGKSVDWENKGLYEVEYQVRKFENEEGEKPSVREIFYRLESNKLIIKTKWMYGNYDAQFQMQ